MNSSISYGKIENRKHWMLKRDLRVLGIDSTFVVWRSRYSELEYCGLTGAQEKE
ncbi:MAG: hypothetical protein SVK08_09155 [Halobacteriota archaeon]|nr:hypothetical protein [Halobacteriota archaeon]